MTKHNCKITTFIHITLILIIFFADETVVKGDRHYRKHQRLDKITRLPGQPVGKLNFSQYSGFVTVDKKAGRALFYWLIESPVTNRPNTKPLLLWLNGGPGCSSIAYGASEEVGPFRVQPDGKTLSLSPFAWNKEANLLFLDSPAGVGFSYSNTSTDTQNIGDTKTARDTCVFLRKWLERFPEYKHRPFYIAGESYAGHYTPQLALLLTRLNKGIEIPVINFMGFLVGNPVMDEYYDNKGTFEYWFNHGLISHEMYKLLNKFCLKNGSFLFPKGACNQALFEAYSQFGNINPYDIYSPVCPDLGTSNRLWKKPMSMRFRGNDDCIIMYTKKYMNRRDVQKALHANTTGSISEPWASCSEIVRSSWKDSPKSMLPVYKELIAAGVRIWIFSGDTDAVLPITATRYSINALNLKTVSDWYPWYDSKKVGGWSQVYEGLTYVTVRGAGHEVPLTRPCLAMLLFRHFLRNQPMPQITIQG